MRKRLVLFGFLAVIVLAVVYGLVLIRHGFSARDNPSAFEATMATTMRRMAIPRGASGAKNPFSPTPEVMREARIHFADHCAQCHANDGSGNTPIGQNLYPKSPDMRLPATQDQSDGELYYTIHNGIRLSGMPAWGPADSDNDSWKLVLFIRHLPQLTPEEKQEMEKYNPVSRSELEEEREAEEFLSGQEPQQKSGPTRKKTTTHH